MSLAGLARKTWRRLGARFLGLALLALTPGVVLGVAPGVACAQEAQAPFQLAGELDTLAEFARALDWLPEEPRSLPLATSLGSHRALIDLNARLVTEGALEESVTLCVAFSRAFAIDSIAPQRALYLAAQSEIRRQRFDAAEALLDELDELQGRKYGPVWLPYEAWELGYAQIARADLAVARGLLDQARLHARAAERQYETPEAAFRERWLGTLRIEIDRIRLDLLLGASRFEGVRELAAELLEQHGGDSPLADVAREAVLPRLGVALHLSTFEQPELAVEAQSVLDRLRTLPGVTEQARFDATFRIADLLFREGDARASIEIDAAASLARSELEQAVAASLAARRALSLDGNAQSIALAAWQAAFTRLLDAWRKDPPRPGGSAFLQYSNRRFVVHAGIQLTLAREPRRADEALEIALEVETLSSLARRLHGVDAPLEPVTVEQIQSELRVPGEVYLLPLACRWGTTVFAVSRGGVMAAEGGSAAELSASVRGLRHLLARPPSDVAFEREERATDYRRLGTRLRRALIPQEFDARVRGAELITLVDENVFGPIPLELCVFEDAAEGAHIPVARTPSFLLEWMTLQRGGAASGGDLLLLTNAPAPGATVPEAARSLLPVDLTSAEMERLTAPFDSTSVWQGLQASEGAVTSLPLDGARMLEFVVHGQRIETFERSSTLVLGVRADAWRGLGTSGEPGDGLLDCDEVDRLNVPNLVVLATCGSAQARERVGDGGAGDLGGAFLQAGARTVVLARDDIPLAATLELLAALHDHLARGANVASALSSARATLATGETFADPYYWAQLQVFGDGSFRPFPGGTGSGEGGGGPRAFGMALLALAAAFGIGGAWTSRRRRRAARLEP